MSLQPRFEDVLHLVMWNGYTEDARKAVYVSKEVYTDERVWFPFLIQQTYGEKKKTLLQVIAEHCTPVEPPNIHKVIPKKGGIIIYKPEERWMRRMAQLQQMAKDSYHMKTFERALQKPDTQGRTILVAACKNNCAMIVSDLLKRGFDYNQEDNVGATPQYYAFNSKFGRKAWSTLLSESKFQSKYSHPRPRDPVNHQLMRNIDIQRHDIIVDHQRHRNVHHHEMFWNHRFNMEILNFLDDGADLIVAPVVEPPKKKLKRSEYKKQFGR